MAGSIGIYLTIIGFNLAIAPAAAQMPPTTLRIAKDKSLSQNLVYWFVAPALPPSAQRPLPDAGPNGIISLEVPADYAQPGAQVKILDARKGLLAHLPIRDTTGRLAGNLSSPNLLQNSNFEQNAEHWIPELSGGQAKGELEWLVGSDVPKGVPGKALRVRVLAVDAVNWHVQFHQMGLDLIDSEPYTLTFWARADRARPLSVNATIDKEDYHWVGLSNQVALTPDWRKFTLVFTASVLDAVGGEGLDCVGSPS